MGMNTRSMLVAAAIAITFVPLTALAQRGGGGGGGGGATASVIRHLSIWRRVMAGCCSSMTAVQNSD